MWNTTFIVGLKIKTTFQSTELVFFDGPYLDSFSKVLKPNFISAGRTQGVQGGPEEGPRRHHRVPVQGRPHRYLFGRVEEPGNFLAAPAPDYFLQAASAPAPVFSRSGSLLFISSEPLEEINTKRYLFLQAALAPSGQKYAAPAPSLDYWASLAKYYIISTSTVC